MDNVHHFPCVFTCMNDVVHHLQGVLLRLNPAFSWLSRDFDVLMLFSSFVQPVEHHQWVAQTLQFSAHAWRQKVWQDRIFKWYFGLKPMNICTFTTVFLVFKMWMLFGHRLSLRPCKMLQAHLNLNRHWGPKQETLLSPPSNQGFPWKCLSWILHGYSNQANLSFLHFLKCNSGKGTKRHEKARKS